jgi:hypothetical protein
MQSAHKAGKKGAKRNLELYKGLQQTKSSAKGGLVTALRHGSEWRSELFKKYYAGLTKAERKKHTEKARIAKAKKLAKEKKRRDRTGE